jgi:hypothetical protein
LHPQHPVLSTLFSAPCSQTQHPVLSTLFSAPCSQTQHPVLRLSTVFSAPCSQTQHPVLSTLFSAPCSQTQHPVLRLSTLFSDSAPCSQTRISAPKRDEATGERRKIHNEELLDLYSSPSIIRMIKARRSKWAGHVARICEKRNEYRLSQRPPLVG